MKVYVLLLEEPDSDPETTVLGVYSNRMAAQRACDTQRAEMKRRKLKSPSQSDLWDYDLEIEEHEVLD